MTAPDTRTVQVERATLPTWGGRALHLTLERTAEGEPERLEFCEGYLSDGRDLHRAVQVPGHVLADLHAALTALIDTDTLNGDDER